MNRKYSIVILSLLLILSVTSAVAYAATYGGYEFDFTFTYDPDTEILVVRAFTDEPSCDKVSFRYWIGSFSGSPDRENKNVPVGPDGGYSVAYDTQTGVPNNANLKVQVHWHTLGDDGEDSFKLCKTTTTVPFFSDVGLPLVLLGTTGFGVWFKKRKQK